MKREEALEYMNRYLDHDLNEEETEMLFRHLGESPDAKADFEFLQGLSDKLESLPDVKPPVSLVDSILPRLDELDRLAPSDREESGQPVVMLPDRQQTPPRRKAAAFWRSTLGRAVGGTAVAAAVLGVFVATYKPQEMPNAEVTSTTAVSNATDDTLVSGGAAENKAVPDLTDPSTEVQEMQPEARNVPEEEGTTQNKAAPPVQENPPAAAGNEAQDSAPSAAPDPSGSQDAKSDSDTSSDAKQGGGGAESGTAESNKAANNDTTAQDAPAAADKGNSGSAKKPPSGDSKTNAAPKTNADSSANANPSANQKVSPKTQTPTPPADAPTSAQKAQPNEGISAFGADEGESADSPTLQDSKAPESGTVEGSEGDARVYSLMAAPTEWASPDSTYLVTYSPGTLTLLKGDRSEELGTLKIDGEATNGVWSADGKTFTYDLVKPDGTTASQIWKVEETTLKPGK